MKKKIPIIAVYFLIGVIFAVIISYSAVMEAYRNKKIEAYILELEQEKEKIQKENDSLTKSIAYFETAEFQEKIAKEKLNLQKKEEGVVIVKPGVEKKQTQHVEEGERDDIEPEQSNYKKWINFFFKYN